MKFRYVAILLVLSIIILVPHSFAVDNETGGVENTVDCYFDVNIDNDGDGSFDNPYKNFTDERIKENSIIHLSKGEYTFEKSRTISNISFFGTNSQDTILNGNGASLTVSGSICFKNMTLKNFRIINSGNLNATGTNFVNLMPSHLEEDKINYYGGAIFAEFNKNIYLDNCNFFNNSAPYGGAIYAKGGNLTVVNSLFYNTTSDYIGGAILGESGVKIIINNTRFILDKSTDDAGGAIYIVSSYLKATNLTISNCSAEFGAGIVSLNCDLDLNEIIFKDNVAKYDGGAIYQYVRRDRVSFFPTLYQ